MRLVTPLILLTVVLGCASRAPQTVPGAMDRCPLPLLVPDAVPGPVGIRVANQGRDAVVVVLDECMGHKRLGSVSAHRARLFELPSILYPDHDSLRLHLYWGNPPRADHETLMLLLDTVKILTVRVGGGGSGGRKRSEDGSARLGGLVGSGRVHHRCRAPGGS